MAFLHLIKAKYPNGVEELRRFEFDTEEIFIGRGADCQIRLDSEQVNLRHARLHLVVDSLGLEDLGSLSGTWVNEQSIKKCALKAGDRLRIGNVYFEILFKDGLWILYEERTCKAASEKSEGILEEQVRALDISRCLPSPLTISSALILIFAFFFFFKPLYTKDKSAWNSGHISKAHAFIASDCSTCHLAPFEQVQVTACISCHEMEDHGTTRENCASCHLEHKGNHDLILDDSRLCATCHADISKHSLPKASVEDVHSFDKHPEFNLPKEDNAKVMMNHRIHLQKNLRGSKGKVTLNCGDCHELSSDKKLMRKISFEKSCSSCHPLGFDDRQPNATVPHGEEDAVFSFLYASFSKLYLDEDGVEREEIRKRMRPGGEVSRKEEVSYIKNLVLKKSRETEKELFTKTSCNLCHDVSNKQEVESVEHEKSLYKIATPNIPAKWLEKANFDHSAHDFVTCISCHHGAQKSISTNDVLMPNLKDCKTCHADKRGEGVMESSCTTCHFYHDQLELPGIRKVGF